MSDKEKKKTVVQMIIGALGFDPSEYDSEPALLLFRDQFNDSYAAYNAKGSEVYKLDSSRFEEWLAEFAFSILNLTPKESELKVIIKILKQLCKLRLKTLSIRVAKENDNIYYDLGTDKFVEISQIGWELVDTELRILFKQFNHQKQQDTPLKNGNLDDFIKFINLKEKKDEILLKVYLVAAFIPDFAHPVLVVQGPQGSAKSTLCRLIKDLVDPSAMESESLSGKDSITQFVQAASHHWLLVLDNLSTISGEISDAISRVCTGGGLSKRKLWTNDDDQIYNFRHLIALNGITQVVHKPDLIDRSLIIQLERISEEQRMTEDELWKKYKELKPYILGSIFTAVSQAMLLYNTIEVKKLPRMADFVKWGCAIAKVIGYTQEEFLAAYEINAKVQTETALESNALINVIVDFMKERDFYEDTPGKVYDELNNRASSLSLKDSYGWPRAANMLSRQIPLIQPVLQELGIKIKSFKSGERKIRITKISESDVADGSINIPSFMIEAKSDVLDGIDDKDDNIIFLEK